MMQLMMPVSALAVNATTFVIAHRLSTVRKSNAIMVPEKGRIVERGDHDELLAAGGGTQISITKSLNWIDPREGRPVPSFFSLTLVNFKHKPFTTPF